MALPTGSFSSPFAGKLNIILTAVFDDSNIGDAGFPSSGTSNIAIRGYGGPSGSPSYTPTIDRYGTTAAMQLNYPGGSVAWPVGVQLVSNVHATGLYSYSMSNVRLVCELVKK